VDELGGDPADVVDRIWRPLAHEQLDRHRRGLPLTVNVMLLPHVSRRTEAIRGPVNGLLVDT
jgi:hypothetical protein